MSNTTDTIYPNEEAQTLIEASGNRGVPFTDQDRVGLYAMTGGLVDAACERFPELLVWNADADRSATEMIAETVENWIVTIRREPREAEVSAAFGFETDNVITRRPCGRCKGLTEKSEVRGTLGDFGVICERCMKELGLLDEYNYVCRAFDFASATRPWADGKVNTDDEYVAMMAEVFTDLRRRYREQPPF
jgi:hypothetical protein